MKRNVRRDASRFVDVMGVILIIVIILLLMRPSTNHDPIGGEDIPPVDFRP